MNNFDGMTPHQLRAELAAYAQEQIQPATPPPLPSGVQPGNRTPEQLQTLSDNWTAWIMERDHHTWSVEEREAVRLKCVQVMKGNR
jgi:hypothetical protein